MSPASSVIAAITLSASLLFAGSAGAQAPPPGDVDSGKVQPLNLKAGCWEVRTATSTDVKNVPAPEMPKMPTADEALKQILAALTPAQRAAFDAATWKKNYEAGMAQQAQAFKQQPQILADAMKKGSVNTVPICTATPFIDQGKQLYGSVPQGCTRNIRPAGAVLRASLTCPNRTIDYERTDSGRFTVTQRDVDVANQFHPPTAYTTTTKITGNWVGEGTPHMPHAVAPVDLDGERFLGLDAIGTFDPFRIVAIIDGNKLTAFWAWAYYKAVIPHWTDDPNQTLPRREELHRLYMHKTIADEAQKMGLDRKQPWMGLLKGEEGGNPWQIDINPSEFKADSMNFAIWRAEYLREQILWNAYMSQAATPDAKRALEQKTQERFKVIVVDPDFFVEPKSD